MSASTYSNRRCRCEGCREAQREYLAEWRRRVRVPLGGAHPKGRAVNENTYLNYRCRCEGCSDSHRRREVLRLWRRTRITARQAAESQ